uniref:Uncharacterized protein n=1 Tax=Meloidogyne enterolobii TaxID=390850 RepID=A0A6V7WWB3_MELEN|nr:unnamed protein product [Meloidogyne enterolobii]
MTNLKRIYLKKMIVNNYIGNDFKKWMHCFCVVTFDLELGQTIEVVYPGSAYLSPIERSDICYLSFPDSNSSSTNINNSCSSSTLQYL